MPALPNELTKRERLKPLGAPPSGKEVKIDAGILEEVYTRLGEAVGAVERGNARAAGTETFWKCITSIWETGKAPSICPPGKP